MRLAFKVAAIVAQCARVPLMASSEPPTSDSPVRAVGLSTLTGSTRSADSDARRL
jgi:hypothetical protein